MSTNTTVSFDVARAREVLRRATVLESLPGGLEFASFDIPNTASGTRTIVAVNYNGGEVHVRIDTVTHDCPRSRRQAESHHLICGGDFHYISNVEYYPGTDAVIVFQVPSKSGVPSYLHVHNNGQWNFKVA